jgi:hypothetical protein
LINYDNDHFSLALKNLKSLSLNKNCLNYQDETTSMLLKEITNLGCTIDVVDMQGDYEDDKLDLDSNLEYK